jgi:hypothetical protein
VSCYRFFIQKSKFLPVSWHDDEAIPASVELQWGKMFTTRFDAYVDGLVGVGTDRPYDYGDGLGIRTMF